MGTVFLSAPPVSANEKIILRIEETFYSLAQGPVGIPRQIVISRFITSMGNSGSAPRIFSNQTLPAGAATPIVGGRLVVQQASGAAALSRYGNAVDDIAVPVEQLFNDPALPSINRTLRSYTLFVPVRVTVVGTAVHNIGLAMNANGLTGGATQPAALWSSDPAVNAGRWLARYRQVNAGAITDGADSGVTTAGWHVLGIRYVEGLTPRIEWLLDGVVQRTVSGDGNMPTFPGGINYPGMCPQIGLSTPAGTTVQWGAASFEVREL